jgi:hypothetical protein
VKWLRDSTRSNGPEVSLSAQAGGAEEGVLEYSLEELAEFLEADLADVPTDLEFKQTLRERLWDLVQTRNRMRGHGSDRS